MGVLYFRSYKQSILSLIKKSFKVQPKNKLPSCSWKSQCKNYFKNCLWLLAKLRPGSEIKNSNGGVFQ